MRDDDRDRNPAGSHEEERAADLLGLVLAGRPDRVADAFLATQGDVWDTQWDMFCALIGATVSVLVLSRVHDRQLDALGVSASYGGAASTSAPRTSTGRTTRRPR